MLILKILFFFYIALNLFIFLRVSKMNGTYFNSYTRDMAFTVLIEMMPFILSLDLYRSKTQSLYIFLGILYLSSISQYLGYRAGFQTTIRGVRIPPQLHSIDRYSNYLVWSTIGIGLSFYLLASRGVGIKVWIFNNRYAYIVGRAGNGIWYVLFQLFIIISSVLCLCKYKSENKRPLGMLFYVFISYFTGSKGFMIGIVILALFFRDRFIRKISLQKLVITGLLGLLAVIILLWLQSGVSLLQYSGYYSEFLRFIEYVQAGKWEFAHGRIMLGDMFWKLIPRSLFPSKPYVYGQIEIVNLFYPIESIVAGNTPSFSGFVIPYADFGVAGVVGYFCGLGFLRGFLEKVCYRSFKQDGYNFNALFLYTMLFLATPVNFLLVYELIFVFLLYLLQTIRIKFSVQ